MRRHGRRICTIDPITLSAKQFCHGEPGAMGLSRMLMHPMRDFSQRVQRIRRPQRYPYRARAQCDERIEDHAVDLQALAECALARAKCSLGRNADFIDAGPPWRRLDALDQLRHLPLECVGWPKEVGPEGERHNPF
jgi:hypothetical protein